MNILICKGYQGRFEYDPEADLFHGEVIGLADVITFQGRSIDELKKALDESLEDYFELCATVGKDPQKPYSGRFNIRITPDVHQRIASQAARDGVSINKWVARTLEKAAKRP